MAQGEFALVRNYLEKALQKPSTLVADSDLYAMLADATVQQRDEDGIRKYAPKLEALAVDIKHQLYLATAHRAWGVLHRLEGQYEEAETRMGQAADIFQGLDTRWQLGRTYFEWGQLAEDREEPSLAKEHYNQALALFEEMGALPDAEQTREKLVIVNS